MSGLVQEVLLALLGYTGDVIVAEQQTNCQSQSDGGGDGDNDAPASLLYTPHYTVNPVLQNDIPSTEQQVIERILTVGSHYATIQRFVQHVTQTVHQQTRSLYVLAFSHGLQQVLQQYVSHITRIERDALSATQLHQQYSFIQLQVELQLYQQMFPLLIAVIRDVHGSPTTAPQLKFHNCSLITLLHSKLSSTGIPQMQATYRQLLDPLLQLLYKQLSEWVLHGELYDPYRELFICFSSPASAKQQKQKLGNALTESPIINQASLAGSTFSWNTDYTLLLQRVPSDYISVSSANKLLFAGKAVHVLKRASQQQREKQHATTYIHHEAFTECQHFVQQLQQHAISSHTQSTAAHTLHIEHMTEQLRVAISKRLYQLVVNDSNLRLHLSTLRQFYLLHAGEFYSTFIQQYNSLTQRPPTLRAEKDLQHSCWLHSAVVTRMEDNTYWKNLTLKFEPSAFSYYHFKVTDVVDGSASSAGFVLSGAAKLAKQQAAESDKQQLYSLQLLKPSSKSSYGCATYSNRRYVAAGFEIKYKVSSSCQDADQGQQSNNSLAGFACVLCNTLPATLVAASSLTASLFQPGSLPNAITVEVNAGSNDHATLSVYHHGLSADQVQCISSTEIAQSTLFQRDLQAHTISIQHSHSDNMLTVAVDDQQLLRVECKIRNLLQLDGGRAYMSFVAVDTTSNEAAERLGMSITGWQFREADAAQQDVTNDAATTSATVKHALGWRNLSLAYNIQSPLDLIIQPSTIDRYNSLFRMLFTLKRVQSELQATWSQLSSSRQHGRMEDDSHQQPTHAQLLQLRATMQFFIDTLLCHLHVDILDVHYTKLVEQLEVLTEFEAVVNAHDQYLNTLITKCFLRDRLLLTTIESLTDACLAFCSLIAAIGSDTPTLQRPTQLQLFQRYSTIIHEWQTHLSFFFTVAARQTTNWSASSLATLIIRLDFNSWFSDAIKGALPQSKQDAADDDYAESKESSTERETHERSRPASTYRPTPQTSMSNDRLATAFPLQTPLTSAPPAKQQQPVQQYRYTPASQVTSVFGSRPHPAPTPYQPSLSPDDQLLFSPVRK